MFGLLRLVLLASLLITLTEAFSWRWRFWKPKKLRDSIPAPLEVSDPYPLFKKPPLVRLPYGTYMGKDQLFTRVYKGIPYAAPPTGSHRFMPPRPPNRVYGIQPALKFGFGCYQDSVAPPLNGIMLNKSEDCLNVNIWAPKYHSSLNEALPVMVWVLPGGFTSGYTSNPLYGMIHFFFKKKLALIAI
jgi:para-nitrobenzyl esterase